ncbi:hypothetical protein NQ318_010095 [Aromia moschata]|uniref:Calcineurin-binding protein cabin-1 n=1 Tax=Aromia moschata TaxID=1265417 RepID=A0AAV8Y9P4_9CUCU|nr:hypothetical protein NQ318_010095 [Aromia moschata]
MYEALDHYLKPTKDPDKWERVLEKCVAILQEIIKKETVRVIDSLREERRPRLVESLSKIASKQLNTDRLYGGIPLGCITPWILLHYVLMREEQREYAIKRISQGKRDKTDGPHDNQETHEVELPPSVAILFSGHEFLGPKGWCLTGQGELLHFILDTVLDRLDTPVFDRLRDKIDIHIEQALFCLYEHPSKKNKISRHLADHNVDPLPLTWERSFQLYEFYGPDRLPEFNSYKNASISTDLEQLLKRIIALVPPDCAPQQHLPKITDYIYGKTTKCPDPIEFPNKVRAIYYLIGDFHFKQREFGRCIKYFQMDLCINPHRLDSWACLGLSYTAQLDSKLNYCEKFKTETEFLDKAKYASICFERALSISPDPLMLWIEYGTFQYTVHSYCSRILKYESENLSMEKFEFLENQKNSYLDSSGDSFEKAIALYEIDDTNEQDERWLQYYILGKIAEKKQKEPAEYLQYYMTATVEALELHYRVHASVLKYLELHEGKEIPNSLGAFFKKCLSSSKFFKKPPPPKPAPEIPTKSAENTSLGFQEQFLNSLNKPIDDGIIKPVNDEKTPDVDKTIVPEENTLVASPPKSGTSAGEKENQEKEAPKAGEVSMAVEVPKAVEVPRAVEVPPKAVEVPPKAVEVPPKAEEVPPKAVELTKSVELPESVEMPKVLERPKEEEDVIMISDSDDEQSTTDVAKPEDKNIEPVPAEQPNERIKVKDVQQMLDEMMVKQMKEVEQQPSEVDSDLSGTEKVEEVVCKEDKMEVKAEGKPEAAKIKEKPKKVKPSDSETDTDNVRTSIDDESSSSSSSSSSTSSSSDSDSDDDDSSSSSSSSSSEPNNENMSNSEILALVDRCCKQLLLGEYKCKNGTVVTGLFYERKVNNFFNGIWRIPSTEIDRPGSLSAHMSRCISLLLQILMNTNDNKTLIELCTQLRRTPEQDKTYIKESERIAFSDQALEMCTQSLRNQMKNISTMSNPEIAKLLQEIFRVHQKVQKHIPGKESGFANMLIEVYRKFIKEKIPENVNVLELATKFCQQNRPVEKPKIQPVQNPIPPMPRGPGIASVVPLKRPGMGRPRGRPPLPKVPGQMRQPRGKSPNLAGMSKSYAWQKSLFDQSYAYEYLKHYHDELIKQYSQNLSMQQLTQLSQILNQGQLSNPLTASAITNQFLAQTGLLTPSALVKQMSSTTAALGHLKKKLGVDQALSSLTTDQLKFLGSMLPSATKAQTSTSRHTLPHTVTSSSGVMPNKPKPLHVPNPKPSTSAGAKPLLPDPGRAKQGSVIAKTTTPSTQLFKEPPPTKTPSPDEKAAKVLMKDRPSISITPVTGSLPPPATSVTSFPRPSVPSGKTLQEKLAEKKKEQFNKEQLKKTAQAELYNSEALIKSLNLPSIPSSLTVSKASIPITSSYPNIQMASTSKPVPNIPKQIPSSIAKFPMDLGRPVTIMAAKSVAPQPKFTMEPSIPPI